MDVQSVKVESSVSLELNGFIETAEKHAMIQNETEILCPCRDCKNNLAWKDVSVIRSHLIMWGVL